MKRSRLVLRSLMFVPGHNERLLEKASKSKADALIFDVEDSVMPAANKQIARECIRNTVATGMFNNYSVFPRINDRQSGHMLKDVQALTIDGVQGFVYPKATQGEDIYFFDKLLETVEYEKGYSPGTFKIIPLIETAAAVLNAQDICLSSERVVAVAYGCEDFIADLEGIHDHEGVSLYVPRAMIAMAARAAGVIPIDTVHIHVHDLGHLEENVKLAKILGFEGMLVLHPKELDIVHRYFTPTEHEVKKAEEMLHLAKEAEKMNKGVALLNGKFVGPPMVLAAEHLVNRASLIMQKEIR
ncbi:MAG: CoA ester lyase [Syntrophales bacterium]|jgi:citrate lyase subunit beta/citryl-CoA lyase|nr:CoA ester lyase [Syntrophales bacterium]MDY0045441.1 CoA ester lyase [Syntrophales bacterium]